MKRGFTTPIVTVVVALLMFGTPLVAWITRAPEAEAPTVEAPDLGADPRIIASRQVGNDPDNGDCLTTDGTVSTWNATCGSGGSGSIGTSTTPNLGDLAYWTGLNTLGTVATGTLTETATGLEFDATRGLVGGAAILSLTSGYVIPLTASTTNWNNFYDTPSTRITAGTNLTWSGNTINVDDPFTVTDLTATNATTTRFYVGGESTFNATSTWAAGIHPIMHGIYAADSSGLHLHSNNGTEVAFFGAGGGANITFPNYTSALLQTGVSGALAEYAGTACTNQFVRSLSALAAATCATVDISSDTNLTAGDGLTLTDDDIDFDGGASPGGSLGGTWASPTIDDLFVLNTSDTMSGSLGIGTTLSVTGVSTLATTTVTGDFSVNSDDLVVNTSTGFVGIGSTTPANNLTISNTADSAIYLEADTNNVTESDNPFIKFTQDGGAVLALVGLVGDAGRDPEHVLYTDTLGNSFLIGGQTTFEAIQFGTNDAVRMTVANNGNVGIGDTTPSSMLTVGSGDLFQIASTGNLTTSNAGTWTFSNDTNFALTGGINGLSFDTDTLSIDGTNNRIGIGTTTPLAPLHVASSTAATSTVQIGRVGSVGCIVMRDTDNAGYTYLTALNGVLSASVTSCE